MTGPPPSCDLEAYSRQSEKTFGILESMTTGIDQNLLAMFKEIFISTEVPEVVGARNRLDLLLRAPSLVTRVADS